MQNLYVEVFFFFFFLLFRAEPAAACRNSQARDGIRAAAAGLHHSHSNTGSLTHWTRPGVKPASSKILVGFLTHWATMGTLFKSHLIFFYFFVFLSFVVVVVAISWAAPAAYGDSQARGWIGAIATGLRQSHCNAGSEPRLQPTPQLTATPDH